LFLVWHSRGGKEAGRDVQRKIDLDGPLALLGQAT
jgi:hypothetical protein